MKLDRKIIFDVVQLIRARNPFGIHSSFLARFGRFVCKKVRRDILGSIMFEWFFVRFSKLNWIHSVFPMDEIKKNDKINKIAKIDENQDSLNRPKRQTCWNCPPVTEWPKRKSFKN